MLHLSLDAVCDFFPVVIHIDHIDASLAHGLSGPNIDGRGPNEGSLSNGAA